MDRASNRNFIIRHPILAGQGWGLLTALLVLGWTMFSAGGLTFHRAMITLAVFVLFGPVWGYAMRWAYLRSGTDAR